MYRLPSATPATIRLSGPWRGGSHCTEVTFCMGSLPKDSCLDCQLVPPASPVHSLMCLRPNVTNAGVAPCVASYGFHSTPYTCGGSPIWPLPVNSTRCLRQSYTYTECMLSVATATSRVPVGLKPSATMPRASLSNLSRTSSGTVAAPSAGAEPARESHTHTNGPSSTLVTWPVATRVRPGYCRPSTSMAAGQIAMEEMSSVCARKNCWWCTGGRWYTTPTPAV
mmetsp:Transcript_28851/g.73601  ORF Transcript_28851/g.73601 Transcript_28851/m.73601 type:complete len:224 (-) Transcript_28851:684-1355(-)